MLDGKHLFKMYLRPELKNSSLIVGWREDAGKLGSKVIDYLNEKLVSQGFAEIEPADFFPLEGVLVEDDVAQFPESKFYCCQEKNLVIFKSDPPRAQWHKFLNAVLDVAEHYCQVKELYTIGSMITSRPHTTPRQLLAVVNSSEMKESLSQYDVATDLDYETPPGQRPTLSSFLLWAAKRRNLRGVSLWVPIPFYLVAMEDPQAWRKIVEFLDRRFGLEVDFNDLDEEVARQNERIAQLRIDFPDIDHCLRKLESSLGLTPEENEKLVKEIEQHLRKGNSY